MAFSFKAKIYKVGINPCVDVPEKISSKLKAGRGYILIPSRQNEINKYIGYLKTDEARDRNIEKVVKMLEEKRTRMF